MRADIAIRNRAIKRVGYGVQDKVGIGMPNDATVMRHRHAAQHNCLSRAFGVEAVYVKPLSGARDSDARGKIGFMRHFDIIGVAGNQRKLHASQFRNRRIIRQPRWCRTMGGQ